MIYAKILISCQKYDGSRYQYHGKNKNEWESPKTLDPIWFIYILIGGAALFINVPAEMLQSIASSATLYRNGTGDYPSPMWEVGFTAPA